MQLVLVAHDEMTAQANDASGKRCILGDEYHLWKKGPGCGVHKSDVICSATGWLKETSQSMEYGKNYEGYWSGELFMKRCYTLDIQMYVPCQIIIFMACGKNNSCIWISAWCQLSGPIFDQ